MARYFWIALFLVFFFANEYLAEAMLMLTLGDMTLLETVNETARSFDWESYMFTSGYRLIPFALFAVIASRPEFHRSTKSKVMLWLSLVALAAFHLHGYWLMQEAAYTNARMSSTSALEVIFVPITATMLSCMLFALIMVIIFIRRWATSNR